MLFAHLLLSLYFLQYYSVSAYPLSLSKHLVKRGVINTLGPQCSHRLRRRMIGVGGDLRVVRNVGDARASEFEPETHSPTHSGFAERIGADPPVKKIQSGDSFHSRNQAEEDRRMENIPSDSSNHQFIHLDHPHNKAMVVYQGKSPKPLAGEGERNKFNIFKGWLFSYWQTLKGEKTIGERLHEWRNGKRVKNIPSDSSNHQSIHVQNPQNNEMVVYQEKNAKPYDSPKTNHQEDLKQKDFGAQDNSFHSPNQAREGENKLSIGNFLSYYARQSREKINKIWIGKKLNEIWNGKKLNEIWNGKKVENVPSDSYEDLHNTNHQGGLKLEDFGAEDNSFHSPNKAGGGEKKFETKKVENIPLDSSLKNSQSPHQQLDEKLVQSQRHKDHISIFGEDIFGDELRKLEDEDAKYNTLNGKSNQHHSSEAEENGNLNWNTNERSASKHDSNWRNPNKSSASQNKPPPQTKDPQDPQNHSGKEGSTENHTNPKDQNNPKDQKNSKDQKNPTTPKEDPTQKARVTMKTLLKSFKSMFEQISNTVKNIINRILKKKVTSKSTGQPA